MKSKFVSLVVCLAFLAMLAVSAVLAPVTSGAVTPPVWKVGDNWTYNIHYNSGPPPPPGNPIIEDRLPGMSTTISSADDGSGNYIQNANFLPDWGGVPPAPAGSEAHRNTLVPAGGGYSPVTVLKADVKVNKADMEFRQEYATIFAFGTLADNATINFAYDAPGPSWPPVLGATWTFTKHTFDALGIVNYTVHRTGKVLEFVPGYVVPAGSFDCWHIVEYDNEPFMPPPMDTTPNPHFNQIVYEHWFNEDQVGSDVAMLDRDTYQGQEYRELTSWTWAPVPIPTTTSLSPTSKVAGDAAFTLTVNGTNFVAGSVVKWNGSNRTTHYTSATQLTADITAADIATAGTVPVTVFNTGAAESNPQTFTVNNPVPTTTSLSPTSKVAGDAAFTLTVNGTNFVAGSVVKWNGSNRTTTYVSATQLTADITAADIATAGTVPRDSVQPHSWWRHLQPPDLHGQQPCTHHHRLEPDQQGCGRRGLHPDRERHQLRGRLGGEVERLQPHHHLRSATQLTASIPAADIATAGTAT